MKGILLTTLIVVVLIACGNHKMKKSEREGEPNIYSTTVDDQKMNLAIATAKQTLNIFDKALLSNLYDTSTFALKVKFPMSNGYEHIWVTSITIISGQYFGIVDNLPELTTKVNLDEKVGFDKESVTDWMYSDKGILRGGYTIKVIRNQMTKEDRERFDADFPFKIED
jgi:uncharacterized protein YegJ (DUF2314 family)